MSTKTKSIFSGMGGLIGTLAGLVSVAVGVLTIGSMLGWFDSGRDTDSDSGTSQTGNTTPGSDGQPGRQNSSGGQGGASAAGPASFTVAPTKVSFTPLKSAPQTITLTNKGAAPFSVDAPQLEGSDADKFEVKDVSCDSAELQGGRSCQVKVEFTATQGGNYDAQVVIPVSGSGADPEVPVEGEKLL